VRKAEARKSWPCPGMDLISRCCIGDRAAKEELARLSLARVRKTVLLVTGGGPDTDDLVQITLVRAFSGLLSYRGEAPFTAWLDRVTINAVKQYYRRRPLEALFPSGEPPELAVETEVTGPDRRLEGQRMLRCLTQHLMSLRPKKRMAVVLCAAYGYSLQEVAEIMECTLETAKKRLQHGRRELLARMTKDNYLCQALKEIAVCIP